jgi:hypothetical protein
MKSSTDYKPSSSLAVLLVGEQKTGKTRTLFSFPDPWILDVDRNLYSAVRVAPGKKFWFDDPYLDATGTPIADPPLDTAQKKDTRWARATDLIKAAAKEPEVKTIVVDGLGGFADMFISHLMFCAYKDEGKKLDRLRIQDYQPLKTGLTSLIMALRGCGKFIVFTSHQKTDKDDNTGRIRYTLNMPGSLSENFGGFFTNVWATNAQNVGGKIKYEIMTKPSGFHVSLGSDRDLQAVYDVTDKNPNEVWAMLAPKLLDVPISPPTVGTTNTTNTK